MTLKYKLLSVDKIHAAVILIYKYN